MFDHQVFETVKAWQGLPKAAVAARLPAYGKLQPHTRSTSATANQTDSKAALKKLLASQPKPLNPEQLNPAGFGVTAADADGVTVGANDGGVGGEGDDIEVLAERSLEDVLEVCLLGGRGSIHIHSIPDCQTNAHSY